MHISLVLYICHALDIQNYTCYQVTALFNIYKIIIPTCFRYQYQPSSESTIAQRKYTAFDSKLQVVHYKIIKLRYQYMILTDKIGYDYRGICIILT
jgi:hypothetical protein